MRITGGEFRSRKISVPPGSEIRPTSDKMRQVIFNMLLKYELPQQAVVLDAFCGSGALGLEALSRGVAFCTFMDQSKRSLDCCRNNVESLKVSDRARFVHRDVLKPGAAAGDGAKLVFLDPPYRKGFVAPALESLAGERWISAGTICVAETEKEAAITVPEKFTLLDVRAHGGTKIIFLKCG